jgi:hypothetical protein
MPRASVWLALSCLPSFLGDGEHEVVVGVGRVSTGTVHGFRRLEEPMAALYYIRRAVRVGCGAELRLGPPSTGALRP